MTSSVRDMGSQRAGQPGCFPASLEVMQRLERCGLRLLLSQAGASPREGLLAGWRGSREAGCLVINSRWTG